MTSVTDDLDYRLYNAQQELVMTKVEKKAILELVVSVESALQIQAQAIDLFLTTLEGFKEKLVTKR